MLVAVFCKFMIRAHAWPKVQPSGSSGSLLVVAA